jgi:hypothetical protein
MNRIHTLSHSNPFAELEPNEEEDWGISYNLKNIEYLNEGQISNNSTDIKIKNLGNINNNERSHITESYQMEKSPKESFEAAFAYNLSSNEKNQIILNGSTFEKGIICNSISKEEFSYEGLYLRDCDEKKSSIPNQNTNLKTVRDPGIVSNQGVTHYDDTIQQSDQIRNVYVGKKTEILEEFIPDNLNEVQETHHK